MRKIFFKCVFLLSLAASAQAVPFLQTDGNGKLTGATGVDVSGVLYNVVFRNGACADVLNGCDSDSDLVFHDAASASAASQALLDQVFLDVDGKLFDSVPRLTVVCPLSVGFLGCSIWTPWAVGRTPYTSNGPTLLFDSVDSITAFNGNLSDGVGTTPFSVGRPITTLGELQGFDGWAIWSLEPNSVPEPSLLVCFIVGLFAMVLHRGQKRSSK